MFFILSFARHAPSQGSEIEAEVLFLDYDSDEEDEEDPGMLEGRRDVGMEKSEGGVQGEGVGLKVTI